MQTIEKEDGRVAKMRQLEKIFRCDPDLVREYQQREQDKLDYQISLEARGESRDEIRRDVLQRHGCAAEDDIRRADEKSNQVHSG